MFKIYNMANMGQVFAAISNGFLDYVPDNTFQEVSDIRDADIIFMAALVSDGRFDIRMPHDLGSLTDAQNMANLWTALAEKPRIIWVDTMGPSLYRDPAILDPVVTGLSERDILISPASLPTTLKLFTNTSHLEKFIFRPRVRFERVKGSVIASHDQVVDESIPNISFKNVLADIMDVVSHLYITGRDILSDEVVSAFGKSLAKVSAENLTYPQGVAQKLSMAEFVLVTHTRVGIEIMGVEGGLSGCQPIYPDTEFYRDIFDDTGVIFFDTNNPTESLREIIRAGSKFDKKTTEAFRTKFSAEDTLPGFWENVYKFYGGKDAS